MTDLNNWKIETDRLIIKFPQPDNETIEFFYRQWTNGEVMKYVGFPNGLKTDRKKIQVQLERKRENEFNRVLIVTRKSDGVLIGEGKLGTPDENNIANTDVKLSPEYWGNKYGIEIKQALVDYHFENTDCAAVEATPNIKNIASIKMQEAVGGIRIKEETYIFPEDMKSYTCDLELYIYHVTRENWNKMKGLNND